jgi:hypothetical protein
MSASSKTADIYAEIEITYAPDSKKTVLCVLQGLPEDPTRDEILEAAEDADLITDQDLNFNITAVSLSQEEFEEAQAA